jgi:hypothetical protein
MNIFKTCLGGGVLNFHCASTVYVVAVIIYTISCNNKAHPFPLMAQCRC